MEKGKDDASKHAQTFELAGQALSLEGTSSLSQLKQETAKGGPIFHSTAFGGQTLSLSKTSGLSKFPQASYRGIAAGKEQADIGIQPKVGIDQPTVIRGSAGVYPK